MANTSASNIRPSDVINTVKANPLRYAFPVAAATLVALVAALVRPATWEATQAMIVRDEAAGSRLSRPGKFDHIEEMKSVQETILELGHSVGVMEQSLIEVGPPAGISSDGWPTARDIEKLQDDCKITPPKGAEFGKTEVFYLKVQAGDKARAIALANAVSHQLQVRFEELRKTRAQSVTIELQKTVGLAEADLNDSTALLTKMECSLGQDLTELRILNESPSGESDLRKMAVELESELRIQRAAVNANSELLKLLESAQEDPGRLLASPSRLLESQPALKRLKDGLVDAQLATAKLQGTLAPEHPLFKAAKVSEQEISGYLHDELAIATKGVESDIKLANKRVADLTNRVASLEKRREKVSAIRAEYANLASVTRHRTEILKTAQLALSEARATEAAAHRSNLISLIDQPDGGNRPIGPGRSVIVLAGMLGGLLISAGVLFLSIHPATATANEAAAERLPAETFSPVAARLNVAGDLGLSAVKSKQAVKHAVLKLNKQAAFQN